MLPRVALTVLLVGLVAPGHAQAAKKKPSAPKFSGYVWVDADRDGRLDRTERARSGVTVELQRRGTNRRFTTKKRVTTDRLGKWGFTIGTTGTYRARVVIPTGFPGLTEKDRGRDDTIDSDFAPSSRASPAFAFRRGGKSRFLAAGLLPATTTVAPPATSGAGSAPSAAGPAATPTALTIGDRVWRDANDDGLQSPGEPTLAGVTVELWNADRTAKLAETVSAGTYALSAPGPGDYRVRVVLPAGFIYTGNAGDDATNSDIAEGGPDAGFSAPVSVGSGPVTTVDIGLRNPASVSIGGHAWFEHDDLPNGLQNASDQKLTTPPLVTVWNASRTQVIASAYAVQQTGAYSLGIPEGGRYRVCFTEAKHGLWGGSYPIAFSAKNAGNDDTKDSDVAATGPDAGCSDELTGAATTSLDAGYFGYLPIDGTVWRDAAQSIDGIRQVGETLLSGVRIEAWKADKSAVVASTTSTAIGTYKLFVPGPGSYRVKVPSGLLTLYKQGANPNQDSDVWPAGTADHRFSPVLGMALANYNSVFVDVGFRPLILVPLP
ncbi:MAG: hypothetical protein JHC95_17965 [Solirubrobacteraceae bacterium]|nr:hypothetical protein [Solirubrobacteraceae bacterium]